MFIVNSDIRIGIWHFNHCVDCEIQSSIDNLTGTCKITLPRKYRWIGKDIAMGDQPYISRRDPVIVKAGYDGEMKTEFIGFVKDIRAGMPVTIECEDSMFLLKQKAITITMRAGKNLDEWLDEILPKEVKYVCNNVQMGELKVTEKTPSEILDWIKSNYGFASFFRLNEKDEPVLYVGMPYSQLIEERRIHGFRFGLNIINPYDLVYKREEDVRIKIRVVGVDADNTRKEIEVGDPDGELRTAHYYKAGIDAMRARAQEDLKRFKYTGYRGSFESFGIPSVKIGDIASIKGNEFNPDGKYLIKSVVKRIGVKSGYKQTIGLHRRVDD